MQTISKIIINYYNIITLYYNNYKIILLGQQNYYKGYSNVMSSAAKRFNIPVINMSIFHNYFNNRIKLFLHLIIQLNF